MNWQITTRNSKTGATEMLYLEAVDREEVFAELTKRGIVAVRVKMMDGQKPRMMPRASGPRNRGFLKGFLALLIIVGGAAAIGYWFLARKPVTDITVNESRRAKIVEAEPSAASPVASAADEKESAKKEKALPPQKIGETRNGFILLPSGRLHRVRGVITNSLASARFKSDYEIFEHHCENEIACLLTMKPGETLAGTPIYNGRFVKEFLESLKTPILIKADDSEADKELKRAVIQAKADLKAAYDRGEDIEKIMLETREEFQDLARYKMEIEFMIQDYRKGENVTDQDIEDYVQGANKLLEQKGIAPLNIGPLTRRNLRKQMLEKRRNNQ